MSVKKGQKLADFGYVRKLPSGRFKASYIGPDDHRHSRPEGTFPTMTDARGWLYGERKLIDLETWRPPATRKDAAAVKVLTLREWSTEWITTAKNKKGKPIALRTKQEYQAKLRLYILPTLGDISVAEIDQETVQSWIDDQGNDHPTATRHAYGVLSACLNAAIKAKKRTADPVFAVEGGHALKPRKHNDLLSRAELEKVAATMTEPGEGFAVLLMAWCGFRPGELFELRRKDVTRDRTEVTASRSISRDRDTLTDHVGPTKTEDIRTVPLPPHLVSEKVRTEFLASRKPAERKKVMAGFLTDMEEHLSSRVGLGKDALLFPDPSGGQMRQRQFGDRFKAALVAAGIESDQRVYDLKAYAATMTLLAGGTLLDAMHRLGHKTPDAAMHYQRRTRGNEVAEKLSAQW